MTVWERHTCVIVDVEGGLFGNGKQTRGEEEKTKDKITLTFLTMPHI